MKKTTYKQLSCYGKCLFIILLISQASYSFGEIDANISFQDSRWDNVFSFKQTSDSVKLRKLIIEESKFGGKLDFFSALKGKELKPLQLKSGIIVTHIDYALYLWGFSLYKLGIANEATALSIFEEYKKRSLNIRERTYILNGFNRKWTGEID